MTVFVDIPEPKSSTPADFATASQAADMNEADVTGLTDPFRAVRYRGEVPPEERKRRAMETLREIKATYSEESDEE